MQRKFKLVAIILTGLLCATLLFSCLFIFENAHHDCTGEDCPICMEIEAAIHTITGFRTILVLPQIIAVLCVITQICIYSHISKGTTKTLITWKVELLD